MTETEFTQLADALFEHIIDTIDASECGIDCLHTGSVLELEAENGDKIVINRHQPNREIWLAARSGGHHFSLIDGKWQSRRDGSELFDTLAAAILQASGQQLKF